MYDNEYLHSLQEEQIISGEIEAEIDEINQEKSVDPES